MVTCGFTLGRIKNVMHVCGDVLARCFAMVRAHRQNPWKHTQKQHAARHLFRQDLLIYTYTTYNEDSTSNCGQIQAAQTGI